jgi:hypothetical protein
MIAIDILLLIWCLNLSKEGKDFPYIIKEKAGIFKEFE